MNFSDNLINLRKRACLSQEELASKLDVSRQAVSKWESGAAYPEMDKLMTLCDLFNCTMDDLIKGTIKENNKGSKEAYTKFYDKFSIAIASGVALIILGISLMLLMYSRMSDDSVVPVITFLLFVIVSASIFIMHGLRMADFQRENVKKENPFTKSDYLKEFAPSFNRAIVIGVILVFIGVLFLILMYSTSSSINVDDITNIKNINDNGYIPTSIFMLFIASAVFLFVYYGIKRSKYGIEEANHNFQPDEVKIGKYSSVIMISATIIYLILGFIFDLWHPGWIVYPIGGMLCGIVGTVFTKSNNEK